MGSGVRQIKRLAAFPTGCSQSYPQKNRIAAKSLFDHGLAAHLSFDF
jgi:hypothetical protein